MTFTPEVRPDQINRTDIEPKLAEFLSKIRQKIYQNAGDAPTIEALRIAARIARLDWSLSGPSMPIEEIPLQKTERAGSVDLEISDLGMPARFYRHTGPDHPTLLIYLHGGGWTMLDLDTHDRMMRAYALGSGWNVIGLDYPLAPEVQFPHSLDACVDAVQRIVKQAKQLGTPPEKIVLGGDSSGANMALSIELYRQATGQAPLAGLMLNYGVFDSNLARTSYDLYGAEPFLLTRERMEFFWANYCNLQADRIDPRAAPLRSKITSLAKLPPVHMTIAAQDVLVDENLLLSEKLKAAGVNVTHNVYQDAAHGFLEAVHYSPVADRAISHATDWLKRLES